MSTDSLVTVRLSELQDLPEEQDEAKQETKVTSRASSITSRTSSAPSDSSTDSGSATSVNWEGLEKTEEQEPRDEGTDESTALLLARLEQENAALATNPKASAAVRSPRTPTRPPSVQHLKKLVNGPYRQSLRYSQIPAPPMTELEFWAALVSDYAQTAQRLPTLTSNKLRGGVPPPLRGVVWPSIAGARDPTLIEDFQRLSAETSPYEGLIGKDVGRSFPNVEMFRDPGGEGQQMLGRVLKSFSLYDEQIGYCQGLGFVVGPLLMHMSDAEAFSILVRLMDHYDLRSCYLPDLSGLHLRIYQFQQLLTQHSPDLAAHLDELKVEPLYVSQWFLSFFGVTCPLPMLLRIYDIILSEGATETLMRVALSLMRRNQKKIMACTEFEDVMQLLLSRSLWDTYAQHADDLVSDFVALTSLVSRNTLQTLEESYKNSQTVKPPSLRAAATQLLGRFWGGSGHGSSKSANNLSVALPSRPTSTMRRSPSKQSLTSTLNSVSSNSDASTLATEVSNASRKSDAMVADSASQIERAAANHPDRDLHSQIEDLLTALSSMQKQQSDIVKELQKEREEREEDKCVAKILLTQLKSQAEAVNELLGEEEGMNSVEDEVQNVILRAESRFADDASRRISILQTKHQLRDSVVEWKQKHETEVSRCKELTQRLDAQEMEHNQLKEQLREARARIQDAHKERQRLEKTMLELRKGKNSTPDSPAESNTDSNDKSTNGSGLRELRLGRSTTDTPKQAQSQSQQPQFSKRTSSLMTQPILSTENHAPAAEDTLLLELVNAKTAEAVARQELEEVKGKLDSLRKMLNLNNSNANSGSQTISRISTNGSESSMTSGQITPSGGGGFFGARTPLGESPNRTSPAPSTSVTSNGGGGGYFFSGWGKRSVSTTGP